MNRTLLLYLCFIISFFVCDAEVELITEPKPGQEYVFVQTSSMGAKPITRKDTKVHVTLSDNQPRPFETSHKLPASLTYLYQADENEPKQKKPILHKPPGPQKKTIFKRETAKSIRTVSAPAGAIQIDPKKLIAKYQTELKTVSTTTNAPSITKRRGRKFSTISASAAKTPINSSTPRTSRKRSKKELNDDTGKVNSDQSEKNAVLGKEEPTSPKPIVATTEPVLVASGSEKQRSRIQIKKGPNGQEYEYEYVYYYYDEDDEVGAGKDGKKTVNNEVIPPTSSTTTAPIGKTKPRGRQMAIGDEDVVGEERLPTNTRFPPRSRNLDGTPTTTSHPEPTRGRGRSTTIAAPEPPPSTSDNSPDESSPNGSNRGRTRANVRRPSLELVDSVSFNTHNSSPSFPIDLPAGPVRFLGATPNERTDLTQQLPLEPRDNTALPEKTSFLNNAPPSLPSVDATTAVLDNDVDTVQEPMSSMDKVALDLYAILQGTQRLNAEEAVTKEGQLDESIDSSDAETSTGLDNTESITNLETITSIEEVLPFAAATTTTTTTTTTPKTTTTPSPQTVAEPAFGRSRYRGRGSLGGIGGRKPIAVVHSGSTEAPNEATTKARSRFGANNGNGGTRPSFGGRNRLGARTTQSPPIEGETDVKESSKPSVGHSRFGSSGTRTRSRTTPASDSAAASSDISSTPSSNAAFNGRPSLRPRPTFNLRSRTRPTPASVTEDGAAADHQQGNLELSTARPRSRITVGAGVRPLRPGPRINIGGRGRLGVTTEVAVVSSDETVQQAAASSPVATNENGYDEAKVENSNGSTDGTAPALVNDSPLNKLRNRQRIVPKAKAAAPSTATPPRRVNPLLARRLTKPGAIEPGSAVPAVANLDQTDGSSDAAGHSVHGSETAAESHSVPQEGENTGSIADTTTEEPRGLSKLLGRRRLAQRTPGTIA